MRVARPRIPPEPGWRLYPVENMLDETRNALRCVYYAIKQQLSTSLPKIIAVLNFGICWETRTRLRRVIPADSSESRDGAAI